MYINTFKYAPEDVECTLCTEYVRKLGCTARSCPCITERIEACVVGFEEAVMELFPPRRDLIPRLRRLIKTFPGSMWQDAEHKRRMEAARGILGYRKKRDTPKYLAALYLLTSNRDICARAFNCFFHDSIDFGCARRRGISEHNYTLLMAAKSVYCDTTEVTEDDLADPYIISDDTLRLIVNALLIARFGEDVLKITSCYGSGKPGYRKLILRKTRVFIPFTAKAR